LHFARDNGSAFSSSSRFPKTVPVAAKFEASTWLHAAAARDSSPKQTQQQHQHLTPSLSTICLRTE
jgi:hypothetical protein